METTLMAESDITAPQHEAPAVIPPHLIRREPILDQNRGLSGYRLRILWTDAESTETDPGAALIQSAREHGVGTFLAYAPHWIDASPALLHNAFTLTLPRNRCYLEFPDQLDITPELIESLQKLAHTGLKFSLRGDLAAQPGREALLPFVKVTGFDPALSTKAEIFRQSFQHKQAGRLLMAVNTPDKATLDNFLLLGFTVFQGRWPMDLAGAA
jgi:EAL and modified HD-GYP domain-containing signal transduction protein